MNTGTKAHAGMAFMKRLIAFKAGELVYRSKDKEDSEEMYYVVCGNYYVLRFFSYLTP